jgi:hypothetical protein
MEGGGGFSQGIIAEQDAPAWFQTLSNGGKGGGGKHQTRPVGKEKGRK